MNTPRITMLSRLVVAAGLVAVSALAHAGGGNVYWAVNVDAPVQGAGRISTAVSNTRRGVAADRGYDRGGYYDAQPVVYAPPQVIYAPPPPVYVQPRGYYGEPAPMEGRDWGYGRHHHRRFCAPVAARVIGNVHRGLARMHEDLAEFHEARADAWGGRGRGWGYDRGYDR